MSPDDCLRQWAENLARAAREIELVSRRLGEFLVLGSNFEEIEALVRESGAVIELPPAVLYRILTLSAWNTAPWSAQHRAAILASLAILESEGEPAPVCETLRLASYDPSPEHRTKVYVAMMAMDEQIARSLSLPEASQGRGDLLSRAIEAAYLGDVSETYRLAGRAHLFGLPTSCQEDLNALYFEHLHPWQERAHARVKERLLSLSHQPDKP